MMIADLDTQLPIALKEANSSIEKFRTVMHIYQNLMEFLDGSYGHIQTEAKAIACLCCTLINIFHAIRRYALVSV